MPQKKTAHRVIDTTPRKGHQVIPGWVIETDGLTHWNAAHHIAWRALLKNAWGPTLDDPRTDFEIQLRDLRGKHDSNDRIRDVLEVLQKTLLVMKINGRTRKVQMLGMTDLEDSDRDDGVLRYDFPKGLIAALREPGAYAQIDLKSIVAMTSKYSRALNESIALRAGLHRNETEISVQELRNWLGVADGRLEQWSHFNQKALQPALAEVNVLSRFRVLVVPIKRGKKIDRVIVSWSKKDPGAADEREAVAEVNRHKEGRKQRLAGDVPQIVGVSYTLRPATIERARTMAGRARLDYYTIEQDWKAWTATLTTAPDSWDGLFVDFVRKKCAALGR